MLKTKRLLALVMVIAMLMQTFSVSGFAISTSDFTDFPNDWSAEAMTAAVENGLLVGTTDTTIDPTAYVTRAQFAAIITRAFGATTVADISHFEDVDEDNWFYEPVARAVKMGVMVGTGDTTFSPDAYMRREDIFLTLARVLFISDEDESVLDKFSDKDDIDSWAKEAIIGMTEEGYVNGYEDGTLLPKGYVRRNEIAQLFHNIFKTYISEPGEYKSVSQLGSVIIRSKDVVLKNVTVEHDLVLADGIGAGDLDVNNVDVKGRIIARGGEGIVDFIDVTSVGNVIINDVNGTVNFHNYRDEVPFVNNLVENTPATFLERPSSPGGSIGGGGGTTTSKKTVYFTGFGEDLSGEKTIANKSSTYVIQLTDLPTAEETARSGYTFLGWALDENETDSEKIFTNDELAGMTVKQLLKVSADKTVTYKAVYAKIDEVYSITFEGFAPVLKLEGEKLTDADIPDMPSDEYAKFVGWTENKTDYDNVYTESELTEKTVKELFDNTSVTLYPVYEYKVVFVTDAGEVVLTSRNPDDMLDDASIPQDPEKQDNTFKGWAKDENATAGNLRDYFTGNKISGIAGKYYPIFEENKPEYTIKFVNTLDGSFVELKNVVKGTPLADGDVETPAYDANEYRFLGWAIEETGATAFVTTESFTGKLVESLADTYYAHFEKAEEYSVSFKYADGTVTELAPVTKKLFPTDDTSDYILNNADVYDIAYHTNPADYEFLGWTTTANGTGTVYKSADLVGKSLKEIDGTTYYAQYRKVTVDYTVFFKYTTDEEIATVTKQLAESEDDVIGTVTDPAHPTLPTDYEFAGWTEDKEGTGTVYTSVQVSEMSIKDANGKTFYAQFNKVTNNYTVFFKFAHDGSEAIKPVRVELSDSDNYYLTSTDVYDVDHPDAEGAVERYVFLGWTETKDGTGDVYASDDIVGMSIKDIDGVTFYAQYDVYYKVTFVDYTFVLNGDMDVNDDYDTVYDYLPGDPTEYMYLEGYVSEDDEKLFYVKKGTTLCTDENKTAYDLVTTNYLHNYNEFSNPILGYGKNDSDEYMHENTGDVDTDVIENAGMFNYQHKIDYEWYILSEDGSEYTFFDCFTTPVDDNLVVFAKLKQVQISLKLSEITDKVELVFHFPYESDGRFVDVFRDGLQISRDNLETALTEKIGGETFEDKLYGKLESAGIVTDASTRELANFASFSPINMVYFYQMMGGKEEFADWLWEHVEENLIDEMKASGDKGQKALAEYNKIKNGRSEEAALRELFSDKYSYKNDVPEAYAKFVDSEQFIYEVNNKDSFFVTENNEFIMVKVEDKISSLKDVNDMIEEFAGGKVPEGVLKRLPIDKFAGAYEKRVEYFLLTLDKARKAAAEGAEPIAVDSGIVLDFNLVEEVISPVIEYSVELHTDLIEKAKEKAKGGNTAAELFYKYYGKNKYLSGMVDKYVKTELYFYETDDDTALAEKFAEVGYASDFKVYGVNDLISIYDNVVLPMSVDAVDAFIMATDESEDCYLNINKVTKVLKDNKDVILTFYNHINGLMSGYAKNGLPDSMEQYWTDLNSNATVAEYIEKLDSKIPTPFDVEHYVAKLVNNATIDTFYTRILAKAGGPVETLLAKYPDKELTSEQFDAYVAELEEMWMADENGVPSAGYTAENGFAFMFEVLGLEDGEGDIGRAGVSIKIKQKCSDDVED